MREIELLSDYENYPKTVKIIYNWRKRRYVKAVCCDIGRPPDTIPNDFYHIKKKEYLEGVSENKVNKRKGKKNKNYGGKPTLERQLESIFKKYGPLTLEELDTKVNSHKERIRTVLKKSVQFEQTVNGKLKLWSIRK